jgi:4-amino-4-deoxy-L-arabinose transferase-like glycosyltransferase
MPNLPVAFSVLIATGCFLRVVGAGPGQGGVERTPRGALIGMGVAVAVAALMRPTDAVWLVLPLALAALFVRPWRRPAVLLVLAAGAVLGAAEWIIEAYASYGGLSARLDRAAEIQGGMGGHLGFGHQLRALEGRSLCRPCGGVRWRQPLSAVWWFALPLLTAGGVLAGARTGLRAVVVVPTLTGLSLAVQYLLMIDYAAPRFLLPTYALLLLPAALCLTRLVGAAAPARRPWAAGALALVLAVHIGSQYAILGGLISRSRDTREAVGRTAAELNRLGVRPPCTVNGTEAVRIGFRAGCGSRQAAGHDGSISRAGLSELAEREPVAVLVPLDRPAPAYARGWPSRPFPRQPGLAGFRAYLSPAARP